MKTALLTRTSTSNEGTFGILLAEGFSYVSGELPWNENDQEFSCVPPGKYVCTYTYSMRFKKKTYLLQMVPGRSNIRIHSANFVGDKRRGIHSESEGCILLGSVLGTLKNQKALLNSRYALASFEALMDREPFVLRIMDETPGGKAGLLYV